VDIKTIKYDSLNQRCLLSTAHPRNDVGYNATKSWKESRREWNTANSFPQDKKRVAQGAAAILSMRSATPDSSEDCLGLRDLFRQNIRTPIILVKSIFVFPIARAQQRICLIFRDRSPMVETR
jgi:hypothetical protein